MRIFKFFISGVLLSVLLIIPYAVQADENTRLTFYIGDVHSRQTPGDQWAVAKLNQEMKIGNEVKTGKESRAELTLPDKSVIRIGESTHYKLENVTIGEEGSETDGSLFRGRLWANVKKITGRQHDFKARTITAVAAVRGTIFRVDALPDSITEIFVYQGAVEVGGPQWAPDYGKTRKWQAPKEVKGPEEVSMGEWTEIVRAQQRLIIGPEGVVDKGEFDVEEDKKDEWVAFNLERDLLLIDDYKREE